MTDLKQTQDRLQLIIDHIDTITNVNNFKQITAQNQTEIILKFKELLHTLDHLQPSSMVNQPGYEDLDDTRRKLQVVIGVLLNSLSQLQPKDGCTKGGPMTFSEFLEELEEMSIFGGHPLTQEKAVWKRQIAGESGKLQAGTRTSSSAQQVQIQLQLQPQPNGKDGSQQVLLKLQLKAQANPRGRTAAQLAELAAVQQMLEQEIKKLGQGRQCAETVVSTGTGVDPFEKVYTFSAPAEGLASALSGKNPAGLTLASVLEAATGQCSCCDHGAPAGCQAEPHPFSNVPFPVVADGAPFPTCFAALDETSSSLIMAKEGKLGSAKELALCTTTCPPFGTNIVLAQGFGRLESLMHWLMFFLCLIPLALFCTWSVGSFRDDMHIVVAPASATS
eukprot:GGOE01020206.1.p1 GENE.GGOE01020206.1~~GGOE01020206.1.p1  ORF type:complete len:390 (+),score=60.29 GGOE01020206.1:99-1268(+)